MQRITTAVFALLLAGAAAAQPVPNDDAIPAALKDWRGWVLHDLEFRACPFLMNQPAEQKEAHRCAWPGRLDLAADAGGANFSQHWRVDAAEWLPLPGSADNWPQDVTIDGKPAVVLERDSVPSVWATPGALEIRGRVPWEHRPQQLRVPPEVGLVTLRVDGKTVEPLERGNDQLTLGRGEAAAPEADALSLRVFRKLVDGLPAELETQIVLDVSGQAREEVLAPVLPENFLPIALEGEIPARLDPDGKLHVQVQPGGWRLTLRARATQPLTEAKARLGAEPWPRQEIWSYQAAPELRVTSASGTAPIDPAQAGVPDEWNGLPAFALDADGAITIEERSRGLAGDEANRLTLVRAVWLDFTGHSLFAKDVIAGAMKRDWRLDAQPPYRLERAEADGQGLLVTRGAKAEDSGVELRNPRVHVSAGLRVDAGGGSLPISGWRQAFDSVSWSLYLPYGYRLLGAPGADLAQGSWMSLWTLLDVFVVAIAALLAWRLFGIVGGAAILGYLLLSYHEADAPRWALVITLALGLLLRALPIGKLQTVARWLSRFSLAVLVLIALPFLAQQVRIALYPQLENSFGMQVADGYVSGVNLNADRMDTPAQMAVPAAPPPPPAPSVVAEMTASPKVARGGMAKTDADKLETFSGPAVKLSQGSLISQRYAENTVIQAGRGEPDWHYGSSYVLSWSGPVLEAQNVRLVIAPPWLTRLLRVAMLALLVWAAAQLARRLFAGVDGKMTGSNWLRRSAAVLFAALCVAHSTTPVRAADFPDQALLNQLRERLLTPPKCATSCASASRAEVRATGDGVHVSVDVSAAERVAVPLPGADATLALDAVRVDGAPAEGVVRVGETLWVALSRGVHRIELDFRVLDTDHLALKFELKPARIAMQLSGWQSGGVIEQRLQSDTLTLTRERREQAGDAPGRVVAQQFPPYVRVTRSVLLDLETTVGSTVQRLAPERGGFSIAVEVLKGEQVTSNEVKVEGGKVLVAFDDSSDSVTWSSRLPRAETLSFTAPPLSERAEVWRVTVSPMWHAEFAGVPETMSEDSNSDFWTHEFHPLPGETLTVAVTRPVAVEGRSFAIDRVTTTASAGTRALDTTLDLALRSTQGGEHVIVLPDGAEVLGVTKNGASLNLRPREGKLSLPLTPGAQQFDIRLRQAQELGMLTRTPQIDVGAPAANIGLTLTLPADRWVLWVNGPQVGPAVLYWGELVVMMLVAWALSRLRRTPLKLWHWLLLGFGFSTFSWVALLFVVGWLFALDARSRWAGTANESVFNLAQIGLAMLTLVALLCLVASIPFGLLGQPDMHIAGNDSSVFQLHWFADQAAEHLPSASAITLPLWVYKLSMLAWALWLANALISWLRWGFAAWTAGGYWRNTPRPAPASKPIAPPDA